MPGASVPTGRIHALHRVRPCGGVLDLRWRISRATLSHATIKSSSGISISQSKSSAAAYGSQSSTLGSPSSDDANPRSAAQCRSGAPAAICAGVDCNVTTAPHPARASARSSARSA